MIIIGSLRGSEERGAVRAECSITACGWNGLYYPQLSQGRRSTQTASTVATTALRAHFRNKHGWKGAVQIRETSKHGNVVTIEHPVKRSDLVLNPNKEVTDVSIT